MNKKAVSLMISYVLLISIAVVISYVVYRNLKTYVPQEKLECPDGVSIVIKDLKCNSNKLEINISNNGLFNISGYYVSGATSSGGLATVNIEKDGVSLFTINPSISQGQESKLTSDTLLTPIRAIEMVPVRIQRDNKNVLVEVVCTNARIREEITCG